MGFEREREGVLCPRQLVELEHILRVLLEWILAPFRLLELVLGYLLLVAVKSDEYFRICTSTIHRTRFCRNHKFRLYRAQGM